MYCVNNMYIKLEIYASGNETTSLKMKKTHSKCHTNLKVFKNGSNLLISSDQYHMDSRSESIVVWALACHTLGPGFESQVRYGF